MTTYYIDTRPGAPGSFAPPRGALVDDEAYRAWLHERYEETSSGPDGYPFSTAQHVNQMAVHAGGDCRVMVIGPFAEGAARGLRELSEGAIEPEVKV